jgi:asparagine N-glycosylation enzyme membrane subunit Stt3
MWVIGIPFLVASALFAAGGVVAARPVFSRWGSLTARQRLRVVTVFLALAVLVASFANVALFFTVSVAIGGDTARGKVEGGRYYVSSHGRLTEVSPEVWEYSRVHAQVTWAVSLLGALALAVLLLSSRFPGTDAPGPLTIRVAPEGAFRIGEEQVTIAEAVAQAEATQAHRQNVYVRREYPPQEAPPEAVALCEELLGRGIVFQAVDATPADRGR